MIKENMKSIFQNPYNREDWKKLIFEVFHGVTFFAISLFV